MPALGFLRLPALLLAFAVASPSGTLGAQTVSSSPNGAVTGTTDSTLTPARMDAFVKAQMAVTIFRDSIQAELANPTHKKLDVQASLREKMHTGVVRVLNEHGLTEEEFHRLTRRISTDDSARKLFEDAFARVSGAKPAAAKP